MRHPGISAILILLLIGVVPAFAQVEGTAPLIERTKFFGNLAATQGQVSPDGKWLSWLAPRDDVMNVWIAPLSDLKRARPLTREPVRPIRQYRWAPDSSMILYLSDQAGDESFALYKTDLATGQTTALTPTKKVRTNIVGISSRVKDHIVVTMNDREPTSPDLYSLNLRTGERTLLLKNDGEYSSFLVDDQLNLRAVTQESPDDTDLYHVVGGKVERKPFSTIPYEDGRNTSTLGFSRDGRTLYWLDTRGRDTAALVAQDLANGTMRVLAHDARADIGNPLFDPKTGIPDAYPVNYMKTEWKPLNAARRADLAFLQGKLKGEMRILSRSDDDGLWVVSVDPVTSPVAAYLYDRTRKRLGKLYVSQPALETAKLAPVHPFVIKARDGLPMVSYLTLPVGTDPDGDGRPNRPLPTVLLVHGGPWLRDSYGFNPRGQWLANRGYAVLAVNFRASIGFGKKFISAGDRQWGAAMQDDLLDAVDWAIANRVSKPDKVAIMGQSYGGFATLAGLAFTPTKFACGVSTAGTSNIETLMSATRQPEAARIQGYKLMGDPRTEEGRADLKARSPLFKADQIRRPLLIGHGANDPRVPKAESDQIVAVMRKKGIPVTYVVFPDEGHNYVRPQNLIAFNAVAENFLSGCLGGRAEPYNGVIEASSMIVESEAPYTPGLIEASRAAAAERAKK